MLGLHRRDRIENVASTSKQNEPIIIDAETNTSDEENVVVTEELLRLKELLETGMFKSVLGHQPLCISSGKQFFIGTPERKVLVSKGK